MRGAIVNGAAQGSSFCETSSCQFIRATFSWQCVCWGCFSLGRFDCMRKWTKERFSLGWMGVLTGVCQQGAEWLQLQVWQQSRACCGLAFKKVISDLHHAACLFSLFFFSLSESLSSLSLLCPRYVLRVHVAGSQLVHLARDRQQ